MLHAFLKKILVLFRKYSDQIQIVFFWLGAVGWIVNVL